MLRFWMLRTFDDLIVAPVAPMRGSFLPRSYRSIHQPRGVFSTVLLKSVAVCFYAAWYVRYGTSPVTVEPIHRSSRMACGVVRAAHWRPRSSWRSATCPSCWRRCGWRWRRLQWFCAGHGCWSRACRTVGRTGGRSGAGRGRLGGIQEVPGRHHLHQHKLGWAACAASCGDGRARRLPPSSRSCTALFRPVAEMPRRSASSPGVWQHVIASGPGM